MAKVKIFITCAYDPIKNKFFFGVGHESPVALKVAKRKFCEEREVDPLLQNVLFSYELDTDDPDFEEQLECCILRSLQKLGIFFHTHNPPTSGLEDIKNCPKKTLLTELASLKSAINLYFDTILYWGDCNLGHPSAPKFPSFLEEAALRGLLSTLCAEFKLKTILVTGSEAVLAAAYASLPTPPGRRVSIKAQEGHHIQNISASERTVNEPFAMPESELLPPDYQMSTEASIGSVNREATSASGLLNYLCCCFFPQSPQIYPETDDGMHLENNREQPSTVSI